MTIVSNVVASTSATSSVSPSVGHAVGSNITITCIRDACRESQEKEHIRRHVSTRAQNAELELHYDPDVYITRYEVHMENNKTRPEDVIVYMSGLAVTQDNIASYLADSALIRPSILTDLSARQLYKKYGGKNAVGYHLKTWLHKELLKIVPDTP